MIYLIPLAGQSNMLGHGQTGKLTAAQKQLPMGYQYWRLTKEEFDYGSITTFGPEVGFSEAVTPADGDTIILAKWAAGGQSLWDWRQGGGDYKKLMNLIQLAAGGNGFYCPALLWMQGEADALTLSDASNYASNFRAIIQELRTDLNSPEMAIIYGQINPPASQYPYVDLVRQAQADVSTDSWCHMVSTDGLPKNTDNVHYNWQGQLGLGARMAAAYLAI